MIQIVFKILHKSELWVPNVFKNMTNMSTFHHCYSVRAIFSTH